MSNASIVLYILKPILSLLIPFLASGYYAYCLYYDNSIISRPFGTINIILTRKNMLYVDIILLEAMFTFYYFTVINVSHRQGWAKEDPRARFGPRMHRYPKLTVIRLTLDLINIVEIKIHI